MNAGVAEQVERLLLGRTRDIRLEGELRARFRERSWPQMSKIIRSWMIWVVVLDILSIGVNFILLPKPVVVSMLLPAALLPPAALAIAIMISRPVPSWLLGLSLLGGLSIILLSVALVGVRAGGEFYERHLTIMLFVAVTAIIIFPIPFRWSVWIGIIALVIYLVFQSRNPDIKAGSALAGTLFFASGVFATIVARRTANLLAYKTFLLELRDQDRLADVTDANARLELLARTDPLTGVANRRSMMETLDRFWAEKGTSGAAMLMCDIDDFKRLNDRLGHAEGDRCLIKVAGIIQSSLRDGLDQVARYGGEEFLVFLPGSSEREATAIAEGIRDRVESASLPNPAGRASSYVTVSIGIALLPENDHASSAEAVQKQADTALYRAKRNGRNRVALHEPEIDAASG